jgi:hypothetical protein
MIRRIAPHAWIAAPITMLPASRNLVTLGDLA